ncbi:MAG: squalene/phytoene synthase family protein [Pedosphaera sp.]|nr:squalene/phytoene synthase family protein [Pedosphaera sp.]
MPETATPPAQLLTSLLRDVSRSFYLTLRALPGSIRPQIGLAYLLARATDTIADTEIVPVTQRLDALHQLRARILGQSITKLDFRGFTGGTAVPLPPHPTDQNQVPSLALKADAERRLLERIEEALTMLASFTSLDRGAIREVLATITSGQELDLRRFAGARKDQIVALKTDGELEDYTYQVAGCVGEFWTKICRGHLFPKAKLDDSKLLKQGVCFGKGLQLINILRDIPADLSMGRCYLPLDQLTERGLKPSDLLSPEHELRFRALYATYLDRAETYLADGWSYTNSLPYRCVRVRLACAWPILIGIQTLTKLRSADALHSLQPVKVTRNDVRKLIIRSVISYPLPGYWRQQFDAAKNSPSKPIASKLGFE